MSTTIVCSLHNAILGLMSLCNRDPSWIRHKGLCARGQMDRGEMVKREDHVESILRHWPLSVVNGCAPEYDPYPRHCAVQVVNSQCLLVSGPANYKNNNVLRSEGSRQSVKEYIYITAVRVFQSKQKVSVLYIKQTNLTGRMFENSHSIIIEIIHFTSPLKQHQNAHIKLL